MQVLVNLIGNALKFVESNTGKIKVSLSSKNGFAHIKVKDNGIGISAKDQKTIFDRFTQVSDAKLGKPQGSGLGLHISKQIIEQHGGEIRVKSKVKNGSVFMVELPVLA